MTKQCLHSTIRGLPRRAGPWCSIAAGVLLLAGCATREKTLMETRTRGDSALLDARYEDAVRAYEAYLEARPGRHAVLYDLGLAYQGMGEASAAREAFSVAYELEPDEPVYIETLARAMAANGEADKAFDLLERIAVESQRADAYLRLGTLLLEEGLADEAVQAMRIAAEVQPSAEPYRKMANAFARFGDPEREIEALRHVLWFEPGDESAQARVRALGRVPGPTFASPPDP